MDEPSKKSKYFKPGFIFNSKSEDKEDSNKTISADSKNTDIEASKQESSSPSTLKSNLYIESQKVNFASSSNVNKLVTSSLQGINSNQKQNPVLQHLRMTRYYFNDSIAPAHYVLYDSCCALFLSLKYHVVQQNYIYDRVDELKTKYRLKILILLMDYLVYEQSLKEIIILAIRTNFTLMLAWSYEEAAKHLENYRLQADRPPDVIRGISSNSAEDFSKKTKKNIDEDSLIEALSTIRSINRTDASQLLHTFETFEELVKAHAGELSLCQGISVIKAKKLHSLFNKPFITKD